jgi:hypothetical protein
MKAFGAQTSFAGGELSPLLAARVDLEQYSIGAKLIKNFTVMPHGGLQTIKKGSRVYVGFYYIKIFPFTYSSEKSWVFAIARRGGDDGGGLFFTLIEPPAVYYPLLGSLPYAEEECEDVRTLQSGNIIYLFHPNHPVQKITLDPNRDSNGGATLSWKISSVEFKHGPFQDVNTDESSKMQVTYEPNKYPAHPYGVASTSYQFTSADVGRLVRLEVKIKTNSGEIAPAQDRQSGVYRLYNFFGAYTWRTSGKWRGSVVIEIADANDKIDPTNENTWAWHVFKTYESVADAEENFSFSGTVEEYSADFRITVTSTWGRFRFMWDYQGGLIERLFKLQVPTSSLIGGFPYGCWSDSADGFHGSAPATDAWALGAFGKGVGYPSLGAFHQERLILARTKANRQSIWMSKPASWEDFGTSIPAKDDDAITLTLASKRDDAITGLVSRQDLLVFTEGSEWVARAGSKSDVFTPSSITITPSGYYGSAYLEPVDTGDTTLFLQNNKRTVRSIGYSLDVDGYASKDMCIMSEHIFRDNPIVSMAFQRTPQQILWCVLRDGTMAAMSYQPEHKVLAWSRVDLSLTSEKDRYFDVCSLTVGDTDYMYAIYTPSSDTIKYLACFDFSDGAIEGTSNLQYLEGRLELPNTEIPMGGTLQGRHRAIPAVTIRICDAERRTAEHSVHNDTEIRAGVINKNNSKTDKVNIPFADDEAFWGGDLRVVLPGGFDRDSVLRIETKGKVKILGVFPEVVNLDGDPGRSDG